MVDRVTIMSATNVEAQKCTAMHTVWQWEQAVAYAIKQTISLQNVEVFLGDGITLLHGCSIYSANSPKPFHLNNMKIVLRVTLLVTVNEKYLMQINLLGNARL